MRSSKTRLAPLWAMVMATVAGALTAQSRADVIVPWDARLAPLSAEPGAGLKAEMWNGLFTSTTTARQFADTHSPDAHFKATQIDYPRGTLQALDNPATHAQLIGTDLGSSTAPGTANAHNMMYRFSGYVAIPDAGTFLFVLGNGDGARLTIGGVEILNTETTNAFYYRNENVRFSRGGMYAIQIDYFSDWSGVTGVELQSTLPGGQGAGVMGAGGVVPTSSLYTVVPAPGSAGVLGAMGLVALRRRRR